MLIRQPNTEIWLNHKVKNYHWQSSLEYQCDPTPNGLSDNCIGCICEASTRCNVTTKCISGVRDLKHLFARSWGNVTYWSMSSHSMKKKHHKKYRKPITKSSKLPIRGRFADLFCSQSRSGLTEARAFSRETPLVIQELGGDVPLTLFALQTLFALTLTDLERTVMAMPWLRVKIIQWSTRCALD